MKEWFNNLRPWISTIVLVLLAAFTIVRMQSAQATLIETVDEKLDCAVYEADKTALIRELDLIHKTLERIEDKL